MIYDLNSGHPDGHTDSISSVCPAALQFSVLKPEVQTRRPSSRCHGVTGAAGVSQGDLCERNGPGIRRPLG